MRRQAAIRWSALVFLFSFSIFMIVIAYYTLIPGLEAAGLAACGNHVSRDAWADWDAGEQEWVLGAVFDYGHCHDCDGEASLEGVEL